jgi:hypothetical protein
MVAKAECRHAEFGPVYERKGGLKGVGSESDATATLRHGLVKTDDPSREGVRDV